MSKIFQRMFVKKVIRMNLYHQMLSPLISTRMVIITLFIRSPDQKLCQCPSIAEWINKVWYVHIMEWEWTNYNYTQRMFFHTWHYVWKKPDRHKKVWLYLDQVPKQAMWFYGVRSQNDGYPWEKEETEWEYEGSFCGVINVVSWSSCCLQYMLSL